MEEKIKIKYYKKEEKIIRIFGEQFVKNNEKILKMEIEGEKRELSEYYDNKEKEYNFIDISLIGMENVNDISYMFAGCSSLFDISNLDTSNVKNMSYMFYGCSSLSSLPDISKWDTSNVIYMSHMFDGCINFLVDPFKNKF